MIRFALTCPSDHQFDSWFQSGEAFDRLRQAAQIVCPYCGAVEIEKSLMAPSVVTAPSPSARPSTGTAPDIPSAERSGALPSSETLPHPAQGPGAGSLSKASTPMDQAIAQMRREVEANSEYVGLNFAREARAIHEGDAPARAIYGEARPQEARKLIEDGVPVAPLPFFPPRKTH
jgi:hypothetical protein